MDSTRKKWILYDLHMHSFASKKKDKDRVKKMEPSEYVDTLLEYGVEVFSVTDHNIYDVDFYDGLKKYISDKKIKIIDGVELDVYVNGKDYFQMGVYFDKNLNPKEASKVIDSFYLKGKKPKLSEIISGLLALKVKFIMIPEGNKAKGISNLIDKISIDEYKDEIYKYAMYKIFSAYDVRTNFDRKGQNIWALDFFKNTKKFNGIFKEKSEEDIKDIIKKIRQKINNPNHILENDISDIYSYIIKYGVYYAYFSFSDWHNGEPYKPEINNFIFGSLETYFESFEIAVLDPVSRIIRSVDKEIIIQGNILGEVSFTIKGKMKKIIFSPGLNVVVGKRGSGKSLLLSVIERLHDKTSIGINNYKNFELENIKGKNYDGIEISEGELNSIAVLKQDQISDIYKNPNKAWKAIVNHFKDIVQYDTSQIEEIVEISKKIKQYDTNYKSLTSTLKQIKKMDSFTYSGYGELDFNSINDDFQKIENTLKNIIENIDNTRINSKYILDQLARLEGNREYYKKLFENYNLIISRHNHELKLINKGKSELQKIMKGLREEIKKVVVGLKNNLDIKLNFHKLEYLLNNCVLKTPKIELKVVNRYMFVTSYQVPENLPDLIFEKIMDTIKKTKGDISSLELLEKYLYDKKQMKVGYSSISDELVKFVKGDIFKPKKEFFQVNNSSFETQKLSDYDDINKLVSSNEIINLSNASLGTMSVAYLDMIFDLDENILLFDQPEDNIDNDYISNYLVPLIKSKKKEKQLIFVTHNPSVAVYGDAFNYIFASNDGEIKYDNHIIENATDKDNIVKILDGGKASFSNRNKKYGNILGEEEYET